MRSDLNLKRVGLLFLPGAARTGVITFPAFSVSVLPQLALAQTVKSAMDKVLPITIPTMAPADNPELEGSVVEEAVV